MATTIVLVTSNGNAVEDSATEPEREIAIHACTDQEPFSMSTPAESPTEHEALEPSMSGQTASARDDHDPHRHDEQCVQHRHPSQQRHHHADDQDHDAITVVRVERPVFTRDDFIAMYNKPTNQAQTPSGPAKCSHHGEILPKTVMRHIQRGLKGRRLLAPSGGCVKKGFMSLFPFLRIMRGYNVKTDLLNDVMAGLIVGVMNIPQGMAYGMLAKLDPVYGLYVSFFPVICYFFFGTSKHIAIGTFAVVSLMIGQVVEKADCDNPPSSYYQNETSAAGFDDFNQSDITHSPADEQLKRYTAQCQLGAAVAVTFIVGIYQILLGLMRFGFVTIYLSDPLTRALTMSAAVHVATSQIRHMFGVNMGRFSGSFKLIFLYKTFFANITNTNLASLVMCSVSMVIIYSCQRWVTPRVKKVLRMPFPIELIMIIVGTMISHFAKFDEIFDMPIVGEIPTGIPPPSFPPVSQFSSVATDAVGIAIVSFTISISMAKLFAKKHNYPLDPNQELFAYGITNSVCSVMNCYASTASLSRSLVQEAAGGKTQVAGLVSCVLLLVVLLAIGPLFYHLPKCILAAIILVNLKGVLLQITDIKTLYKSGQYFDLIIWLVTATAVIVTDVDTGLYLGVSFALMTVVFRTQRPRSSVLGRIPHTDLYEDVKSYPLAREIPGIKIFRYGASLYYANAEHFVNQLIKKTGCDPIKIKQQKQEEKNAITEVKTGDHSRVVDDQHDHHLMSNGKERAAHSPPPATYDIILDFSSMLFIDSVGVSTIQQVLKDYKGAGVRILIAYCREDVYDKLERAGTFKKVDTCTAFLGVHDAVLSSVESNDNLLCQLRSDSNGILSSVFNIASATENESDFYSQLFESRRRHASHDENHTHEEQDGSINKGS